jgi:hypothetical protein
MPVEARASAKGAHGTSMIIAHRPLATKDTLGLRSICVFSIERRTLDPLPAVELKFYEPAEGDAAEKM